LQLWIFEDSGFVNEILSQACANFKLGSFSR
jgi:hypothetical protein